MKRLYFLFSHDSFFAVGLVLAVSLTPSLAAAQEEPVDPAPVPAPDVAPAPAPEPAPGEAAPDEAAAPQPEVAEPSAAAPEPVAPPAQATLSAVAAPAAPAVSAEQTPLPETPTPHVEEEAAEGEPLPVSVGVWLRAGVKVQNPSETERLDDAAFDGAYAEVHTSGQVHDLVNWTFNLNANGNAGTAGIMDAIVQLDLAEPFHLWVGQHLVPSDRSNFSGPFFMSPWNYPGLSGPRQGPSGRNVGATAWGEFGGGKLKYYAGAFDLEGGPAARPLYTGRLNLAIIGEEPGFYNSSTYYGAKDVLAIGIAGQYQGQTPALTDNYRMFNADILAEFSPGGGSAGTLTLEGAYYRGQEALATDGVMLLGSYLLPGQLGPGKVQLGARYQGRFEEDAENSPVTSVVDTWLAYLIDDYNLRFTATYQRIDDTGPDSNALQLGVQTIQ